MSWKKGLRALLSWIIVHFAGWLLVVIAGLGLGYLGYRLLEILFAR